MVFCKNIIFRLVFFNWMKTSCVFRQSYFNCIIFRRKTNLINSSWNIFLNFFSFFLKHINYLTRRKNYCKFVLIFIKQYRDDTVDFFNFWSFKWTKSGFGPNLSIKCRVSSHSVRNLKLKINQDWCFDNLFICGVGTVYIYIRTVSS